MLGFPLERFLFYFYLFGKCVFDLFINFLKGIPWHDFDWKTYIAKDWDEEADSADPTARFGIDLRASIALGVNRTRTGTPDHRPEECKKVDWGMDEHAGGDKPPPQASVIITYR